MEIRETFPVTNSTADNQDNYLDLLVSIEANEGQLSLLIGVCDDINYRKEIIARYEAEIAPKIPTYQVTLPRGEPSLRAALAQLVVEHEYLCQGEKAVLTVTGAERLSFIRRNQERSEQEIFFGYLQWTREALRQFPYPVVLWVTQQILINLSKKAPDFWSWRNGVFRFPSKKTAAISRRELEPIRRFLVSREWFESDEDDNDNPYFLPIEDLQHLIKQTEEQRGVKDPSLATFYPRVGQIYRRRLQRGEFQDYQQEQALAIEYFRKAVDLQQELGLEEDLASNLNNLAGLYESLGSYNEAKLLYEQAIEINKRSLSESHRYLANSLNFPNRLVPPKHFVGRKYDIQIAFDCISSRNPDYRGHLALWGGPGVGKSSFLNYLTDPQAWESYGEDPSQAIIVYLDCLDIRPFMPSNFWRQLLNLLQNKLEHSTTLQYEVNLLLEKAEVNHNDLAEILQKIGEQDQFLVLLLDNYDAALYSHEHYTETYLEHFLFHCRYLAYSSEQSRYLSIIVTSLRRLNEIGPKLTPGKSPWYNHYFFHLLKPFTDDEVAELLDSIPITPTWKEEIRAIADGNPTLLQNALYRLYSKLRLGQIPEPEALASELLSNNQQFFQQIWELSNELEQTLLMLIALSALKSRLPNKNFDIGGIENILSNWEVKLIDLEAWGVIREEVKNNKKIYSFASSLMGWWVIQKVYNGNEEEIQQREKAFLKIMSHRKVNKLTGAIRWLWQNREVPINFMGYSVRSVFSS
ncbi:MAG: tetratricopeptide repeat protein [Symploca sp. SIO1B1]|nr:tetratricopeptide repeat protein [Symploca sp. SIO1C2]NER95107.1 tetratricopeptide repeat protein [Symploca sp. SIO1B1]